MTTVRAGAVWQAQLRHDERGLEVQSSLSDGQRVTVGSQPTRQRRYE
ncbi:hypothetical protein QMK33_23285 [Hymenobacter sp. H14-R3]|nr:hypothetical protein [Hymenobacter sp. H14-R3]MDJ0368075.1 hypothetical protein [Hymenobacter sp. H14-R3]